MSNNKNNIYIYHIPGVKIGVTRNLYKRVTKQQGYKPGEYIVLETSKDIEFISKREKELQRIHGYELDFNSYKSLTKQNSKKGMKINVTAATTTFPVAIDKLEDYLTDHMGFKWKTNHREHILDDPTAEWIVKNVRVSHFNPLRSYVYNKSLSAFDEESLTEKQFNQQYPKTMDDAYEVKQDFPNPDLRFIRIRQWADARGIYTKGDPKTQVVKLVEEMGELSKAILENNKLEIKDGIGDMVVVLTNLAHLSGFTIEECIDTAYNEIKDRKGKMNNGTFKKETL